MTPEALGGALELAPLPVAAVVDTVVLGGAGALLLTLFGYLFKELRRKDEGVWALVAERDKRILDLSNEVRFWRAKALGDPEPKLLEDNDIPLTPGPAPEPPGAPLLRRRRRQ